MLIVPIPFNHRLKRAQRGASLIEVLVAIVVASLGILALAGLLGTASRFGKTSEYRSVGALLAADLADRMRANPAAVTANNYRLITAVMATDAPDAPACVNPDSCTPKELADLDLAAWRAALFKALPSGTGYVERTDSTNSLFNVWILWQDPDALSTTAYGNATDGSDPTKACPPDFSSDSQPRCMFFRVGI